MSSRPTILICAPDEALRGALRGALTASDQDVREVAELGDAVAALGEGNIDLVIAEGLTASGAIGSLRAARADEAIPILVVSPPGDVEARIAFLEAGADDVIEGGSPAANSRRESMRSSSARARSRQARPHPVRAR